MTDSCCAPGCTNGYKKRKKKKIQTDCANADKDENEGVYDDEKAKKKKVSMFEFPDQKTEQQRRATWIARVPRDDWHPKAKTEKK